MNGTFRSTHDALGKEQQEALFILAYEATVRVVVRQEEKYGVKLRDYDWYLKKSFDYHMSPLRSQVLRHDTTDDLLSLWKWKIDLLVRTDRKQAVTEGNKLRRALKIEVLVGNLQTEVQDEIAFTTTAGADQTHPSMIAGGGSLDFDPSQADLIDAVDVPEEATDFTSPHTKPALEKITRLICDLSDDESIAMVRAWELIRNDKEQLFWGATKNKTTGRLKLVIRGGPLALELKISRSTVDRFRGALRDLLAQAGATTIAKLVARDSLPSIRPDDLTNPQFAACAASPKALQQRHNGVSCDPEYKISE